MAFNTDQLTEGRLIARLGVAPARLPSGAYDLRGANLARLSLTKAHLAGACLVGASLRGCDLAGADLNSADLRAADLSQAKLQRARLVAARLEAADLRGAVLTASRLTTANLAGAQLTGAVIGDANIWDTDLQPADVAGADLDLAAGLAVEATDLSLTDVRALLAWCGELGADPERQVLQRALADRTWRRWRRQVQAALRAIDQRLGPLSASSLSLAEAPQPLTDASLSRTRRESP